MVSNKRPHRGGGRGGGRGGHKGGQGRPFFKKRKMSKKFWQQRKTAEIAPIPGLAADANSEVESSSGDEDDRPSHYDTFLSTFAQGKPERNAAFDSDEDDQGVHLDSENDEEMGENEDELGGSDEESDENEGELDENEMESEEKKDIAANDDDESEQESDENEQASDENEVKSEESDVESDEDKEANEETEHNDPFIARTEVEIPDDLKNTVEAKNYSKTFVTWQNIGNMLIQTPKWKPAKVSKPSKALLDDDEEELDETKLKIQKSQAQLVTSTLNSPSTKLEDFSLKPQLLNNVSLANVKNLPNLTESALTPLQTELLTILTSYKDLYFGQQSFANLEQIRLTYVLHALNHMLKTRGKILKNNERLAKNPKLSSNVRDQGLCRPKIVIIVPFKESARRVVTLMGKLLFSQIKGGNVSNKKRFDEDFGTEADIKDVEAIKQSGRKPEDYYDTFCGNADDGFKLGIAVTKKTLKLYTDFYSSDIILASPLGLRMVIGVEGEEKRDHDFLASIEMVIFDQMDILAMQNWDHLMVILDNLHLQPSKSHGVDFSRVRMWTLNGMSKMYRQTLMFSAMTMPEVNSILSKHCHNYAGSVRLANAHEVGVISSIASPVPIIFHRFEASSITRVVDDRFEYFTSKIMPEFKKDMMYHTMVFVPSYFDYVRVRNWFNASDLDFVEICEYTKDKKIAMARDLFFHSEKHFLLYTERSHFFRRFAMKGIRHLIFYQLPLYPKFFAELCNFMQLSYQNKKGGSDGNMSCTVIYSKYDIHRLAPVVTTDRASVMLQADKNVHMSATGQS